MLLEINRSDDGLITERVFSSGWSWVDDAISGYRFFIHRGVLMYRSSRQNRYYEDEFNGIKGLDSVFAINPDDRSGT